MKILVIGGTGWVGHKIALQFAEAGHAVTICSRGKKEAFSDAVAGIAHLRADKNSTEDLRDIFSAARYDIVIDSVPEEKSIDGIFRHARGLKHYLQCSSTGGYAPLPFIPCNETAPYEGYAGGWKTNKKPVDDLAMDLFHRKGFPATVIRPCYISGPGMVPIDNFGGRSPDFIKNVIGNRELDVVNDGQSLLQPVHVDDLAHSFLLAAQLPQRSIGQIFNICAAHAVTFNRYLQITAAAFETTPKIRYLPLEAMLKKHEGNICDVSLGFLALHMCFDIVKAKEQLAYEPRHTPEQTIEENATWTALTYSYL